MATWPTITDDDGTGTTGTILGDALFDSIRDYIGDTWTSVAYSAGNFGGVGTMTWTVDSGDQTTYAYSERGKSMTLTFYITGTDVGGSVGAYLELTVPNGRTITTHQVRVPCWISDAGGSFQTGMLLAVPGETFIRIYKDLSLGTNWTSTTGDNTTVAGQITFMIDA